MAKEKSFRVVVITPERQVLDEVTPSLVIPAHDGELGVLANRAPLMCELGVGVLRYQQGARTVRVLIDGGFAQVNQNQVIVLTEQAITREEVTPAVIEAAEREASKPATGAVEQTARTRARRRAELLRELSSTN